VVVVAVLLLITYRSPWLWLVPLAVVGLADRVTAGIIAVLSRHTDLAVSNATIGIVSVLVFGAGTDYALLLIARYREELRAVPDRHEAMRRALLAAGPAIAASGVTVAASLASLFLAALPSTASIGVTSAIGVAVGGGGGGGGGGRGPPGGGRAPPPPTGGGPASDAPWPPGPAPSWPPAWCCWHCWPPGWPAPGTG
jgi:hypothetical protein